MLFDTDVITSSSGSVMMVFQFQEKQDVSYSSRNVKLSNIFIISILPICLSWLYHIVWQISIYSILISWCNVEKKYCIYFTPNTCSARVTCLFIFNLHSFIKSYDVVNLSIKYLLDPIYYTFKPKLSSMKFVDISIICLTLLLKGNYLVICQRNSNEGMSVF